MKFSGEDCSPLLFNRGSNARDRKPNAKEAEWLCDLAGNMRVVTNIVVPVFGNRDEDEPVVYCTPSGEWWTGRYVGTISFKGHSLTIAPRFGMGILRSWLSEVMSIVLTDVSGKPEENESFIIQLLASIWVNEFVEAARHGLPALRCAVSRRGSTLKGRLDVRKSLQLIAAGTGQVVSVRSERSLDHAASDVIIAAYQVLRRSLGVSDDQWMPKRAKELIPHLMAVTGACPRVPKISELNRIRYTPITARFASVAELSWRIANHRGFSPNADTDGETKGALLDVAELWEAYVLSVLRKAVVPPLIVTHGTRENTAIEKLLVSEKSERSLGSLIPDAILRDREGYLGVVDAKYKSLYGSTRAPDGPQREDLYQMAAYLSRFQAPPGRMTLGFLAYPVDPKKKAEKPKAEEYNLWKFDNTKKIGFITLPHDPDEAVKKLRSLIVPESGEMEQPKVYQTKIAGTR